MTTTRDRTPVAVPPSALHLIWAKRVDVERLYRWRFRREPPAGAPQWALAAELVAA